MPETPEKEDSRTINAQLAAAGWVVQDLDQLNLSASRGVAVREMQSSGGPADYVVFVDGKTLGVLEAKKADIWGCLDSKEAVPLAVARKAFGSDPNPAIREFYEIFIA